MKRLLLTLTVLLCLPAIGFAQTTWYVPDDFSTIQGAISHGSVINGDTVIVRAGTYVENIDFLGKAITLQSEEGPDVTVIDGNQAGSVVKCVSGEGSNSVLDGFTIQNGDSHDGGGMYNYDSCNPTVMNCTFTGNSASNGGGMLNYGSCNPTVTNCIFSGNSANGGGGMFNYNYSSPTVTSCTFTGNSAIDGGGMLNSMSSPTVTNCIFWNNTSSEIFNYNSSPTVTYSCVQGGYYPGTGNIDADPLFLAPLDGDYHLTYASPCIDVGDNAAPALPSTDFEGDPRILDGDLDTITIVDMGCDEYFPTIYVPDDFSTIQAAINAPINECIIIVRAGTYVENINFLGKAITLTSEEGPDVTFIDGNKTGRVVICQSDEGPDSVLDGFTITNGYAKYGGGMYNVFSSPTVTNCTFTGNSASDDGGGMSNSMYSSPTLTNCTFIGNSATKAGGGMNNYVSSHPTLQTTVIPL
jgi:hypothetical protein